MRGSIITRGNSYRIAVSLGKESKTGKYKQYFETLPQGSSKKDAQRRLRELLTQLDKGTFCQPGKVTVAEYLETWLRDYCRANLAPNTTQTYEFFVHKHIIPVIGNHPLSQLKSSDLQRLYSNKISTGRRDGTGGLGSRSVRYIHITMHRALKSAVKLGLIARNVADSVDVPKDSSREMQIMSESDIHLLLEMVQHTPNGMLYYPLFYTLLFTGMRRSEALALRWSDIDLLACQLSVNRTMHQLHNRQIIFGKPKTDKGRRLIALTPSTVSVLKEHKESQNQTRKSLGLPPLTDDDLVFSQYDGKPLLPDSVTQAWRHTARRSGLRGIRLHDCRHTHASLLLKQNVHPVVVAQRLGHASVQITMDTYSHILPGIQEAVAKRFDDILILQERTVHK
ncbi:tyrosine-type recombinase/integrase [Chloroflexota bacterium]